MDRIIDFILHIDRVTVRFLNIDCSSAIADYIMIFVTHLGNGLVLVPLMAVLLYLHSKDKFWRNFWIGMLVLFLSGTIVQIIKHLVNRHRPMAEIEGLRIIAERFWWRSFPSGHSAGAFSAAVFLANRIKKYHIAFYTTAVFIAISRVYLAVHYPSDIIVGSLIGIIVSIVVLKTIEKRIETRGQ